MQNLPTDETFLNDTTKLYEYHNQLANKYAKIIAILREGGDNTNISLLPGITKEEIATDDKQKKRTRSPRKGGTFESKVTGMLSTGTPMSIREIRAYLDKIDNKKYTSRSVSSQLRLLRRHKGIIDNQKFPAYPFEYRTIWGLSEWFENGKFKQQYLQKISEKVKQ